MAKLSATAKRIRAEQAAATERAAIMANMTEREIVAEITRCEANVQDWQTDAFARRNNDTLRARIVTLRAELTCRRQGQTLEAAPADPEVVIASKLFHGDDAVSDRIEETAPITAAVAKLADWTRIFARPEAINTEDGSKFWFRAPDGFVLLAVVKGANVNDLRNTYRTTGAGAFA